MRLLAELVSDTGHVDAEQWRIAHVQRTPVARCSCGGPAVTDPAEPVWREVFGVRWFAMRCIVPGCGRSAEIPGNRTVDGRRRPSLAHTRAIRAATAARLGDRD